MTKSAQNGIWLCLGTSQDEHSCMLTSAMDDVAVTLRGTWAVASSIATASSSDDAFLVSRSSTRERSDVVVCRNTAAKSSFLLVL